MSHVNAAVHIEAGDTVSAHVGHGIATLTFDDGKARFVVFVRDPEWLDSLIVAAHAAKDALAIQAFEGSL